MTSHETITLPSMLVEQKDLQQEATMLAFSSDQQAAVEAIQSHEDTRLINIHGPSGAGKTFIGWALAQSDSSWSYYPWVPVSPIEETYVVIDNVAAKRIASRRVREFVDFGDVELAVALSREPIPEIYTSHRIPKYTTE